jgi:hypothetical protein
MARISELIISHPEITSFKELEELVVQAAKNGEIHLYFDIKPEFPDTPRKWEQQLELSFYRAESAKK